MSEKTHTTTIQDGRQLTIVDAGDPKGVPVLVHNGTPGSKLLFQPWIDDAHKKGIRLLSYDRPGYAGSTPNPNRTVGDAATDVAALVKALGINRLLTWGISGGGPHSLACAALLPDLIAAAASLASPAPYGADELNWMDGMGEDNIHEFSAALESRASVEKFIEEETPGILGADAAGLVEAFKTLLSNVDVAVLTQDIAQYLLDAIFEGISEHRDGWVDDDLAFVSDWGFALGKVKIPVLLMHGERDKFVPFSHGQWLAENIPGVEARFLPDDGHLTLMYNRIPEVHEWLLEKFR